MVSKEEIQKKYTDLKNRILELNESYHRHDISEVSDEKYDSLFKELIDDVLPYIFQLAIKYILFVINDILIYRFVF